jgi:hypothetical protein
MNHAKTSFSTEIFDGAIISVVQYLAPLRYADEEIMGTESTCLGLRALQHLELVGIHACEMHFSPVEFP